MDKKSKNPTSNNNLLLIVLVSIFLLIALGISFFIYNIKLEEIRQEKLQRETKLEACIAEANNQYVNALKNLEKEGLGKSIDEALAKSNYDTTLVNIENCKTLYQ